MDPLIAHLQRGFDYDLWANLRWLDWIDTMPDSSKAREIMTHIARAQHIWLQRFDRTPVDFDPQTPLQESLQAHTELWRATVLDIPLDQILHWTRLDGSPRQGTLEDVARHVINHGTYHRGHLRGLADAAGFEAFEDTDFARYFDQFPI